MTATQPADIARSRPLPKRNGATSRIAIPIHTSGPDQTSDSAKKSPMPARLPTRFSE